MRASLTILLCVCGSWVEPQRVQGTANTSVVFTVHTYRTAAGQWQAKVDVRHGQGLHDLVVHHRTGNCGEADPSVCFTTTITAADETTGGDARPLGYGCENMPVSEVSCPGPWSPSVQFRCGSGQHEGPCTALVSVGTSVTMACKPGFILRRAGNTITTCTKTGDWSGPVLDCMKVPPGYEFFPKLGWYQLYMIGNTFKQAKGVCEFDGGSLGVVDSPGELEVLTGLVNRSRPAIKIDHPNDIYIGVSRQGEGQEYVSLAGRPMSANYYFKWCPGRPPSTNQFGDCAIYAKQMLCHWDSACERKLPFLCEIPLDGRE